MKRRGFLGVLLASVPAIALSRGDLLWQPSDALPLASPEALLTLNAITKEMHRLILEQWGRQGECTDAYRIGESGLTRQFSLDMTCPEEVDTQGLDRDRYLKPAARAMAHEIMTRTYTRFGALPIPTLVYEGVRITGHGLSLRGIRAYQITRDRHLLRFDIVGGA